MFYFSICSASPSFLKWIQKKLKKLANVFGSISTVQKAYQLRFAKKEAVILFNKMYYKNNLPFLKRKRDKITKFINIDKKHAQVEKLVDSLS